MTPDKYVFGAYSGSSGSQIYDFDSDTDTSIYNSLYSDPQKLPNGVELHFYDAVLKVSKNVELNSALDGAYFYGSSELKSAADNGSYIIVADPSCSKFHMESGTTIRDVTKINCAGMNISLGTLLKGNAAKGTGSAYDTVIDCNSVVMTSIGTIGTTPANYDVSITGHVVLTDNNGKISHLTAGSLDASVLTELHLGDTPKQTLELTDGGTASSTVGALYLEGMSKAGEHELTIAANDTLNASSVNVLGNSSLGGEGLLTFSELSVSNTGTFSLNNRTTKKMFDNMTNITLAVDGTLKVVGGEIAMSDLAVYNQKFAKKNAEHTAKEITFSELTLKDVSSITSGAQFSSDAYKEMIAVKGTTSNDSINVEYNKSCILKVQPGRDVYLAVNFLSGYNTVSIGGGNTTFEAKSLNYINSVNMGSGSAAVYSGTTKTQNAIYGKFTLAGTENNIDPLTGIGDGTYQNDGTLTMGSGWTSINFGNYNKVTIGSIRKVKAGGVNNISFGTANEVTIKGDVDNVGSFNIGGASGYWAGTSTQYDYSKLNITGDITSVNSAGASLNIGGDIADAVVGGAIDLKEGWNSVTIGAKTHFTSGAVSGIAAFTLNAGTDHDHMTEVTVNGNYKSAAMSNTISLGAFSSMRLKGDLINGAQADGTFGTNLYLGHSSVFSTLKSDDTTYGSLYHISSLNLSGGWDGGSVLGTFKSGAISGTSAATTINVGSLFDVTIDGTLNLGTGYNQLLVSAKSSVAVKDDVTGIQMLNIYGGGYFYAAPTESAVGTGKRTTMARAVVSIDGKFIGNDANNNSIIVGSFGRLTLTEGLGSSTSDGYYTITTNSGASFKAQKDSNYGDLNNITGLTTGSMSTMTDAEPTKVDVEGVTNPVDVYYRWNYASAFTSGSIYGLDSSNTLNFGSNMIDIAVLGTLGFNSATIEEIGASFNAEDVSNNLVGAQVHGSIDLLGGYDTVIVGSNTNLTVTGGMSGISYFTTYSGITFNYILNCSYSKASWGDAAVANSYENSNYVQLRTSVSVGGDYTAANSSNTMNIGNYSTVSIAGSILNSDTSLGTQITVGSASKLTAKSIYGLTGLTLVNGLDTYTQKRVYNADWTYNDTLVNGRTNVILDKDDAGNSITGTTSGNSIMVNAFSILTTAGGINLLGGWNSMTVNAQASATVGGNVQGVQALTVNGGGWAYSSVTDSAISTDIYLGKITEWNGTKNQYYTRAVLNITGNYTGQAGSNSIYIGNFATFSAKNIYESAGGSTYSFTVGSNATATIGDLEHATSLTVNGGYVYGYNIDNSQNVPTWTTQQGMTAFTAHTVTGSTWAENYYFGAYSSVNVFMLDLGAGSDGVTIDTNSIFKAVSIDLGKEYNRISIGSKTVGTFTVGGKTLTQSFVANLGIFGVNNLTVNGGSVWSTSSDNWKQHQAWTTASLGNITGSIVESLTKSWDGTITGGTITSNDDFITINPFAKTAAKSMDLGYGRNQVTVNANSKLVVDGDLNGINRLTLNSGYNYTDTVNGVQNSQTKGRTVFSVNNIYGSYRSSNWGAYAWGTESTSLVENTDDTITAANNTDLVIRGTVVSGIDTISLAAKINDSYTAAYLFASTEAMNDLVSSGKVKVASSQANNQLYDIGTTEQAQYFSDYLGETADNEMGSAATLSAGAKGWLSIGGASSGASGTYYLEDNTDCFTLVDGNGNAVTDLSGWYISGTADTMKVTVFKTEGGVWKQTGTSISATGGVWNLTGSVAADEKIGVKVTRNVNSIVTYTVKNNSIKDTDTYEEGVLAFNSTSTAAARTLKNTEYVLLHSTDVVFTQTESSDTPIEVTVDKDNYLVADSITVNASNTWKTNAIITGNVRVNGTVTVEQYGTLTLSANAIENLFAGLGESNISAGTSLAVSGTLQVGAGTGMTVDEYELLNQKFLAYNKNSSGVSYGGKFEISELTGVSSVTEKTDFSKYDPELVTGTSGNDTINIGNNGTFSMPDTAFDLLAGYNSVTVNTNATLNLKALTNISALNIYSGTAPSQTAPSPVYSTLTLAGDLTMSADSTSISTSSYNKVTIGGGIGKSASGGLNYINFGWANQIDVTGDVDNIGSFTIGGALSYWDGSTTQYIYSTLNIGGNMIGVNGSGASINIGSDISNAVVGGTIDLKDGWNSVTIGSNTHMESGAVSGIASYTLNSGTYNASGNKLTVSTIHGTENIISTKEVESVMVNTKVTRTAFTAAAMANTINVGSYSSLYLEGDLVNGGASDGTYGTTLLLGANSVFSSQYTVQEWDDGTSAYQPVTKYGDLNHISYLSVSGGWYPQCSISQFDSGKITGVNAGVTLSFGELTRAEIHGSVSLGANYNQILVSAKADLTIDDAVSGVQSLNLYGGGYFYTAPGDTKTNSTLARANAVVKGTFTGVNSAYNTITVGNCGTFSSYGIGSSDSLGTYAITVASAAMLTTQKSSTKYGDIYNVNNINSYGMMTLTDGYATNISVKGVTNPVQAY